MSRSVVLTGASSGIGEELAIQLARRGDRLALLARRGELLEQVAERARVAATSAGHRDLAISIYPVDVTDRDAMRAIIAEVEQGEGLDLLILNAGRGDGSYVESFDDEAAAMVLDVNVTSTVYALGAALPRMIERRSGHVVGVSSIAGYRGLPGASAYSASKAALTTLLESLRLDLRRHGVRVTVVTPGFVRSPMTAKNRFPMPFMVEVQDAAAKILRGIDRKKREVRFPWPLITAVRLLRAMPDWLFDAICTRIQRPPPRDQATGGGEPSR